MAPRKRKAAALAQAEEPQKPKVIAKPVPSSSDEEEEEDEDEVEDVEEELDEEEEDEEESESDSSEEDDDELKRETLKMLLDPFSKDQILDFLKEAALNNPSIIARITASAESDPVHRKIFVHGLGWDATTDQLLAVFKPFGDVEECKVVTDKLTGRAKGYGFVLFKARNAAKKALKQPQKKVGNRMTSCQLAAAGPPPATTAGLDPNGRKIYVANAGPQINPEKLRAFFAKFGEIEEGPLGHDPVTGKLKGFALFVYKTPEGCRKALEEPVKVFDGVQLQCRRANKNPTGVSGVSGGGGAAAAAIQQSEINTMNYGVGLNVNPAAVLVGQNQVMASALGQSILPNSGATGFSPAIGVNPTLGFGGNYGINSISPNVMGNYGAQLALQGGYGSPAAFQGLGAYQSAQLGQSSAGATSAAATRPQSGFGSVGTTFPSYYGR